MKLRMQLNGDDISKFCLTPLDGILKVLMPPAAKKSIVTNENAGINGALAVTAPTLRKVAKQNISLPFKITAPSLGDLQMKLNQLDELLTNGVNGSGVNELYVPEIGCKYRLVFLNIDKYANFGLGGKATLYLNFTEFDPSNRGV